MYCIIREIHDLLDPDDLTVLSLPRRGIWVKGNNVRVMPGNSGENGARSSNHRIHANVRVLSLREAFPMELLRRNQWYSRMDSKLCKSFRWVIINTSRLKYLALSLGDILARSMSRMGSSKLLEQLELRCITLRRFSYELSNDSLWGAPSRSNPSTYWCMAVIAKLHFSLWKS